MHAPLAWRATAPVSSESVRPPICISFLVMSILTGARATHHFALVRFFRGVAGRWDPTGRGVALKVPSAECRVPRVKRNSALGTVHSALLYLRMPSLSIIER